MESSFKFRCVSSCRPKSVWKQSASVVAKDSALMVSVLTCSPSAPFFFFKGVLDGFRSILAFLLVRAPCGLASSIAFDADRSESVFCNRLGR